MNSYDLIVLGAGPGGYVAAIRAAQLGLKTAVVERDRVGGICLNWGCIPSKALLRHAEILNLFRRAATFGISYENLRADLGQAIDRSRRVVDRFVKGVEFLLRKNKVELIRGEGRLTSARRVEVAAEGRLLETKNIILATGARAKSLPGVAIDGQRVLTSREALELRELPSSIAIIGGGAVGVEFAYLYRAYGSQVTILEMLPHLLPAEDEEISQVLEKALSAQGIGVLTQAQVTEVAPQGAGLQVWAQTPAGTREISAERLLVAIGVTGNVEGLGLETLGVIIEKGFIPIDHRMATNIPGIYAIGDVTGPPLLAHVAMAQGIVAAEACAGTETPRLSYAQMPRATYCQPQVASLGLTEAEARAQGYEVKTGKFPFRANGKALALGEDEGLVKLVVEARHGELLGAHLIGPEVTELLGELSLARVLDATTLELGRTVHPHPTLSEVLAEAALAAEGEAIHI